MKSIGERLIELENELNLLKAQLLTLTSHIGDKYIPPVTYQGRAVNEKQFSAADPRAGFGATSGKSIAWNNKELNSPAFTEPGTPTVGYNKHTHTRFSGGALLFDGLEIVEYDFTKRVDKSVVPEGQRITNQHSQGFWPYEPKIQTVKNSKGEIVDKIGQLKMVFNPDTQEWGTQALEIDVAQCYFVKRRTTANKDEYGEVISGEDVGSIEKDSKGQEMKSHLMMFTTEKDNNDTVVVDDTKSSIIWDENGKCWRMYAVYAPSVEPIEEE